MIAALLTALVLVPTLSVNAKTLHWTPAGQGGYRLQERVEGKRESVRVQGTSYAPPSQPGKTVEYRVRAYGQNEWSNTVTISWSSRHTGKHPGEGPKVEEPPTEEHKGEEEHGKEPPHEEPPAEEPHEKEQPHEEPPLEEEELPEPPLEEPHGSFLVGLNAGYWGSSEPSDLRRIGNVVRLDTPPKLTPWESAGLKVIADFSGPYSSSGVSGL